MEDKASSPELKNAAAKAKVEITNALEKAVASPQASPNIITAAIPLLASLRSEIKVEAQAVRTPAAVTPTIAPPALPAAVREEKYHHLIRLKISKDF